MATDASKNIWEYSIIGGSTNDSLYVYPENGGQLFAELLSGRLHANGYSSVRAGKEGVHIDGGGNAWVTSAPTTARSASPLPDILVAAKVRWHSHHSQRRPDAAHNETGANALALDGSGNVWIGMQDGTLLQFLGLATPVATPILYNQIGVKP